MAKKVEEPTPLESAAKGEVIPASDVVHVYPKPVPEWIKCKVNVPNCHVGEILCQIPGSTPEADKRATALRAAAAVRGIALNASGVPQFATAPEVEYLES